MTTKKLQKIEIDYKSGMTYKAIEKKYKISSNELQNIIKSQKWKRKSNHSEALKGNQNAKGNKGGGAPKNNKNAKGNKGGHAPKRNKNAVVTGEFETIYKDVLNEKELDIYNNYKVDDPKEKLIEEIKTLTIRELRMMTTIKKYRDSGKDLTIQHVTRNKSNSTVSGGYANESSTTFAESTDEKIQRIEEALTRVQESKRKCLESLHKFDIENNRFELELLKMEREVAGDEPENNTNDKEDSLLETLNVKAKEVWADDIS